MLEGESQPNEQQLQEQQHAQEQKQQQQQRQFLQVKEEPKAVQQHKVWTRVGHTAWQAFGDEYVSFAQAAFADEQDVDDETVGRDWEQQDKQEAIKRTTRQRMDEDGAADRQEAAPEAKLQKKESDLDAGTAKGSPTAITAAEQQAQLEQQLG